MILARAPSLSVMAVLATCLYTAVRAEWSMPPAEDAAILLRYARHLGTGDGMAWNPGGPPVDGATDVLVVWLIAALHGLGAPLENSARGLALLCHGLTVGLVVHLAAHVHRAPAPIAILLGVLVATGPAPVYVEAAYVTTVFAAAAVAAWTVLVTALTHATARLAPVFGGLALVMGLVRPEGVWLALLFLMAGTFVGRPHTLRPAALWTAGLFVTIGGGYLAWRLSYFGHVLPLPFLKKGGGALHWDGLVSAVRGSVWLLWPVVPILILALRPGVPRRWSLALGTIVGGFTGIWLLLSGEMNYFYRHQYVVFPIVMSSIWMCAAGSAEDRVVLSHCWSGLPRTTRRAVVVGAATLSLVFVAYQHQRARVNAYGDGRLAVAELLAAYADRDYTLLTTEAGLLPLYSRWRSVDAWGLNDPELVRRGGLDDAYLAQVNPAVIMLHGAYEPLAGPAQMGPEWNDMLAVATSFAHGRGYVLAAAFGVSPHDVHLYYIAPGIPDAARLVSAVRATHYAWWGTVQPAINYAGLLPH